MKSCIEIEHLVIAYHGNVVLNDVSLVIPEGKIIGIIGPNGSGKTSFLKGILELIPVQNGKVSFFGKPLKEARSRVAYVPQRESVDWDFPITVKEVVAMGRLNPKTWWKRLSLQDKEIISDSLRLVGLIEFENRQIGALSGGQQQRVFLARALAQRADLIVMDEPFVGIDMPSQDAILHVLQQLRNEGKTILMVHHDLSAVATYFEHVILLKNELIAAGPTAEVLRSEILAKAYGASLFFKGNQDVE